MPQPLLGLAESRADPPAGMRLEAVGLTAFHEPASTNPPVRVTLKGDWSVDQFTLMTADTPAPPAAAGAHRALGKHTPAPPERREEQQLESTGVCPARSGNPERTYRAARSPEEPQAVANFSSLIAAKSLTSPPMRLVA
jgi:hypothetical protein